MKPELKLGRPCIGESGDSVVKGAFVRKTAYGVYWLLTSNNKLHTCKHVKPDLSAPPMNGDEVEYGYEGEHFEYHGTGILCGEYIDPQGTKSFAIVTEKGELRLCKHVRFPQQSKRERVRYFIEHKSHRFNTEEIADKIDQIYMEDE